MEDLAHGFGEGGESVELEFFDSFGGEVFVEVRGGDAGEGWFCGDGVWCGGESCPTGGT